MGLYNLINLNIANLTNKSNLNDFDKTLLEIFDFTHNKVIELKKHCKEFAKFEATSILQLVIINNIINIIRHYVPNSADRIEATKVFMRDIDQMVISCIESLKKIEPIK